MSCLQSCSVVLRGHVSLDVRHFSGVLPTDLHPDATSEVPASVGVTPTDRLLGQSEGAMEYAGWL